MRLLVIDDLDMTYNLPFLKEGIENISCKKVTYNWDRSMPEQILLAIDRLEAGIRKECPDYVIVLSEDHGEEYTARLAARLGMDGLTNVESISFEEEEARVMIPVYNGNLGAEKILKKGNMILSMNLAAMDMILEEEKECDVEYPCENIEICGEELKDEMLICREKLADADEKGIKDEKNVVIIGHAFHKKEQLEEVKKFCEKTGFALGGSRPTVIDGLLPASCLVGMSGNRLHADTCLVLGASGSSAFLEGTKYCKNIIAVNSDVDAGIFRASHSGFAGDCHDILSAMNAILEER